MVGLVRGRQERGGAVTNVIDETWTVSLGPSFVDIARDDGDVVACVSMIDQRLAHARAMLAAQAPAMARLLVKLTTVAREGDIVDWTECAACGLVAESGNPHRDTCEIAIVLRAAGVLP